MGDPPGTALRALRGMVLRRTGIIFLVWGLFAPGASAADGFAGQLQTIDTPAAAALAKDDLIIGFDLGPREGAVSFGFQATEALQVGLRFPRYGGTGPTRGSELGLAYQIRAEGALTPSLGFGLVGLGADDRGAGEYVIAGKSFGPLAAGMGAGWGRYAGLGSGQRDTGAADGRFQTGHLFTGSAGGFANVAWQTPLDGLSLQGEYAQTPLGTEAALAAIALGYQIEDTLYLTAYGRSDDSYGLRLSYRLNPANGLQPAHAGRGPHPFLRRSESAREAATEAAVRAALEARLRREDITLAGFVLTQNSAQVLITPPAKMSLAQAAGRSARVLSAVAPASITRFEITRTGTPFDSQTITLDRAGLEAAHGGPDAAAAAWAAASVSPAPAPEAWAAGSVARPATEPFSYGFSAAIKAELQSDGSFAPVGTALLSGRYALARGTDARAALGYRFLNQWTQVPPPAVPTTRSDLTSYTPDEIYLDRLALVQKSRFAPTVFGRVSLGYFERQYAGTSAELLWRPATRNLALGVEATYAAKRAYDNWFGFAGAEATTLIASLYSHLGQDGNFAQLDLGQYLGGDLGGAVTVGRNFPGGWRIATTTGWSAERDSALAFGIALDMPLEALVPGARARDIAVSLGGPSGDFAARVRGTGLLYDDIRDADRQVIKDGWGQFWN